jgi:hypothetical protein
MSTEAGPEAVALGAAAAKRAIESRPTVTKKLRVARIIRSSRQSKWK